MGNGGYKIEQTEVIRCYNPMSNEDAIILSKRRYYNNLDEPIGTAYVDATIHTSDVVDENGGYIPAKSINIPDSCIRSLRDILNKLLEDE